jgi:hypothetical protein
MVAFAVLIVFAACSATITRTQGPAYDARITGSDADSLRVRDRKGNDFVIPREDVRDIDHPGNVLGIIGIVIAGLYGRETINAHDDFIFSADEARAIGLIGMSIGIGLALGGLIPYARSKRAAEAFEDANPELPVPQPVRRSTSPLPSDGGAADLGRAGARADGGVSEVGTRS